MDERCKHIVVRSIGFHNDERRTRHTFSDRESTRKCLHECRLSCTKISRNEEENCLTHVCLLSFSTDFGKQIRSNNIKILWRRYYALLHKKNCTTLSPGGII